MKGFILSALALTCLAIYLFVTAPPPLQAHPQAAGPGDIAAMEMFASVNAINAAARKIYTGQIVGPLKAAGFGFGEDWKESGVDKGPLPALFLREVAAELERLPVPLSLYLGSDHPINPSNLFEGDSLAAYQSLLQTKAPVSTTLGGQAVALFPDIASTEACVVCHNDHKDSPKHDWKVGDIMGATTWTWPAETLGARDYEDAVLSTYRAVELAYSHVIDKAKTYARPPVIADRFPAEGDPVLPDVATFMAAVYAETANRQLSALVALK